MGENLFPSKELAAVFKERIYVKGKFLYCGQEKFYVKGVTYGTFRPQQEGWQYPAEELVETDFRMMSQNGINCVRTYTVPPDYVLDIAGQNNLKVMIGLPWEQHITFLDSIERQKDIIKRVQEGVQACKQHPAILCFAIGNEIPANIVRWYGKDQIESFLKQLYQAVKAVDPQSLVTYVNFPTTEYLDLDFLDFDCFNVYLETPQKLSAYIARLHNLSGDRPLVLAEIGLDSLRKGLELQAETLRWQIETVFARGCAGMFVFAWTDEWWRGGFDIEDWDFGIVDRQRNPKPALHAVSKAMLNIPFSANEKLPFISVVVCTYNGSATIHDCMKGLMAMDYPNYEVIVVDDGSTDTTAQIVNTYPVKLITTPNEGLSSARNKGLYASAGEIIAYLDDDAYPDPHWLRYLAAAYLHSDHAGIGGPNIAPPEDGPIAKCVANSPGGPVHVLLSDEMAEHIPGCNMSFRKDVLLEIGGFDSIYRAAGDDVDVCWRVQQTGRTIGFHPSAVVWHHRRNSIKAYWNQQKGYGKAEALLEAKWPEKYNGFGHLAWAGRIYGNGFTLPIKVKKEKIFYGTWGTALFQSVYQPAEGFFNALPLMPEWYLLSGIFAMIANLGVFWAPLLWLWPVFVSSVIIVLTQAGLSARRNVSHQIKQKNNTKYWLLITLLHLIQPVARLYGRIQHGLTPWRINSNSLGLQYLFVWQCKVFNHWSEEWRSAEDWLVDIEKNLIELRTRVKRGGEFDRWDIQVRNGLFSITQALLTIEEHGSGKQMLKLKIWRNPSKTWLSTMLVLLGICTFAAIDHALGIAAIFGTAALLIFAAYCYGSASTIAYLQEAFGRLDIKELPKEDIKEKYILSAQTEEEVFLQQALEKASLALQNAPSTTTVED
jgi:glycosyltransferase involved in cell wall biosynthesis